MNTWRSPRSFIQEIALLSLWIYWIIHLNARLSLGIFPGILLCSNRHAQNSVWVLHILQWISSLQSFFLFKFISERTSKLFCGQLIKLHMDDWSSSVSVRIFIYLIYGLVFDGLNSISLQEALICCLLEARGWECQLLLIVELWSSGGRVYCDCTVLLQFQVALIEAKKRVISNARCGCCVGLASVDYDLSIWGLVDLQRKLKRWNLG